MSEVRRIVGWAAWSAARALVGVSAQVLGRAPLGIVADDLAASMGACRDRGPKDVEVA
jgi:hypothetical protein